MADLRFGIAFQTERLALIREIARNMVGESLPAAGPGSAGPATPSPEAYTAEAGETFNPDGPVAWRGSAPELSGLLAGMRAPPTVSQSDAFLAALGQFATSEPALAAMLENAAPPDAPAAAGVTPFSADTAPATGHAPTEAIASRVSPALSEGGETRPGAVPPPDAEQDIPAPVWTAGMAIAEAPDDARARAALSAGGASASGALASTEALVERSLLDLGLAEGATAPAAMRSEVGGIIASFVLNAHFQPGWPPLRPVQDPEAKAFVAQLAKDAKLSRDDIATLTYLANFGLNRTQLARILKLVAGAANRSRLLQSIAQLLSNVGALLSAVQTEIRALADEVREARAESSRRERLSLR